MNYLLTLAYDGTRYCGFQVQANGRSIAAEFQDALERVLGMRPDIKGCSRTDAGVHALGFALNFHAETRIPPEKLPLALNRYLPPDIRVLAARVVPEEFHARYAAHTKTYLYRIRNSAIESPFDAAYTCRYPQHLDETRMAEAAKHFEGTHDFLALCAAGSSAAAHGDTVRTITECRVCRTGDMAGDLIEIWVTADGYLYNMVRILAGTLCEVGAGRMQPGAIPALLAGRDRSKAGPTLAAKGLFLHHVEYDRAEETGEE
jgi:tRNA pseudouridine38-40 synthase